MTEDLRVAEMLCTRLCHDLTGPIGAVNNGAEFLSEEGFNLQNEAVDLITTSAFSAVARLQFYRIAYGRVKEQGEAPLAEYQRMAQDFFKEGKVTLEWPDCYTDASGVALSLRMVRLLFNLLIVASGALLKGGTISIAIAPVDEVGKALSITASGDAVKWDAEVEKVLTGVVSIDKITPKNVQLYLTRQLADLLHVGLSFTATPENLVIQAERRLHESALAELEIA